MPWRYLFTASQTELGKDEEWFWDSTPKKIVTMIEEKKKINIENHKALAFVIMGGDIDNARKNPVGTPGIDYPAGNADMPF